MALKHPLILTAGIPLLAGMFILLHYFRKKTRYTGGIRAANTRFASQLPEYRRLRRIQLAGTVLLEGFLILALLCTLVLAARPYRTRTVSSGTKKRDIFLCMDVSYSIYNLNFALVESLEDVVRGLEGDRFGISIFNTSTVLYVPMTDDYDFVIEKLEELKEYFRLQKVYMDRFGDYTRIPEDEWEDYYELWEKLEFYDAGTLINNQIKGSSLIGEGLASCLYSFPKFEKEARTRVVILSTDNAQEARSAPLLELDEAAKLCRKNDVTVFGIFPNRDSFDHTASTDYETDLKELKEAVEMTGGVCYKESETLSVDDIVKNIQKQEAMIVQEITIVREVDQPQIPAVLLLISLAGMFSCGFILRKL